MFNDEFNTFKIFKSLFAVFAFLPALFFCIKQRVGICEDINGSLI